MRVHAFDEWFRVVECSYVLTLNAVNAIRVTGTDPAYYMASRRRERRRLTPPVSDGPCGLA